MTVINSPDSNEIVKWLCSVTDHAFPTMPMYLGSQCFAVTSISSISTSTSKFVLNMKQYSSDQCNIVPRRWCLNIGSSMLGPRCPPEGYRGPSFRGSSAFRTAVVMQSLALLHLSGCRAKISNWEEAGEFRRGSKYELDT